MQSYEEIPKSGYLSKEFQLFHITDKTDRSFQFHYHEFNKIIIFLSGNVTYVIEGKSYKLKPWDILLINHHDIHCPIINSNETYDRIILWVDSGFLQQYSNKTCDLSTCFQLVDQKSFNLIRLDITLQDKLRFVIQNLEYACNSNEFGHDLLSRSLFIEFLIYLNRIHLKNHYIADQSTQDYDEQIILILQYIKEHLSEQLSIETIANNFFMNKHYLMHKFKAHTGYTLHQYITNKRLFYAVEQIKKGTTITNAAAMSGFSDYSTFLRCFRKTFHCSPREFFQSS